jgi:DNA repair exonuclease SbcCD ATPase subunit/DNA repair exonuclease SbcCD nuclease subunit
LKLIITGDWQLDAHPPHDQVDPATQRSVRFQEGVDLVEKVLDLGLGVGATGLLFLGDLTEHKKPEPLESTAAAHLFEHFLRKGEKIWAIAGNHDGSLFHQSSSSIEPLAVMGRERFRLFHQVEVDLELGMLAVPYIHTATPDQVKDLIAEAWANTLRNTIPGKFSQPIFAACHYGAQGSVAGYDNRLLQGDYLSYEQLVDSAVAQGVLPPDHIFGGHIHKSQNFMLGASHFWHPGSTAIQNIGERGDGKTWILFDTVTREVTVHEIPQPRKFVVVPYSPELATAPAAWEAGDIVQLQGEHDSGDFPAETMEAAYKAGVPRPFSMDLSPVKPKRKVRAGASLEISTEGGLQESLRSYVKEKYPNLTGEPSLVGAATAAAMDCIQEQGLKTYCPILWPREMGVTNLLSIKSLVYKFILGQVVLITGENGKGKTNFFEDFLWISTGETSKGLQLAGIVNRDAEDGEGYIILDGKAFDGTEQSYRITRGVKLSKAGKPTQRLRFEMWSGSDWTNLSDGSIAEIQKLIDALLGGSYQSIKTTAFKFQSTPFNSNPFIAAHPTERKAILGEILGLGSLYSAHKVLDKRRLESLGAWKAGKDRLAGMIAAGEGQEARLEALTEGLAATTQELLASKARVPTAEAIEAAARTADTAAKAASSGLQASLDALPNTQALVSTAEGVARSHKASYDAQRAPREARWNQAVADIKKAETDLAGMKAPDPAEIVALEASVVALSAAYEAKRTEVEGLARELATAESLGAAKATALADATAAEAKAQQDLQALPASGAVDEAAERAWISTAEADLAKLDELVQAQAGGVVRIQEALATAKKEIETLKANQANLQAGNIEICPTCSQKVDQSHTVKELEKIALALPGAEQLVAALEGKLKAEQDLLAKIAGKKSALQMEIKTRTEALSQVALRAERLRAAETALAGAGEMLSKIADEAEVISLQVARLKPLVADTAPQLVASKKAFDDATNDLASKKAASSEIGALQGKLATLRKQHEENTAAGIAEAEAYEAEASRLAEELKKAYNDHTVNQAVAESLRVQLVAARTKADAAAIALTQASVDLQTAKGAVATAEARILDQEASIKAIQDQKGALETARFELGTLEQRSEIDTIAVSLVDPKSGLPAHLVDRSLPFLEDRINLYMEQLGAARLSVSFAPFEDDKDSLAIVIDDGKPGRKPDIRGYSGGQLERVEYSVKFAMADLVRQVRGVTLGLMCFDEPSGGLHATGKAALVKLLHERIAVYPVTMIISHDEALMKAFDHQLTFSAGVQDETLVAA